MTDGKIGHKPHAEAVIVSGREADRTGKPGNGRLKLRKLKVEETASSKGRLKGMSRMRGTRKSGS
ncbi:MAG: hypothetical protein GY749_26275 [Desulfobacteraceae bacterium]|nr:hypothetical protein [Desulfobacteraceae bacterium]